MFDVLHGWQLILFIQDIIIPPPRCSIGRPLGCSLFVLWTEDNIVAALALLQEIHFEN